MLIKIILGLGFSSAILRRPEMIAHISNVLAVIVTPDRIAILVDCSNQASGTIPSPVPRANRILYLDSVTHSHQSYPQQ